MADEPKSTGTASRELTIFISYRRSDTRADAGRLYDSLRRRFGKDQLFMDVDTLQPGQDWVDAVETAVARCDVLLALIGDEWATVVDPSGRRRIEDDLDRVRLEIEAALRQDKPVIPVLFDDARMPGRDELPESLQSLRRRHAMRLAHDTFRYDLEPLIHSLRSIETAKRARLGREAIASTPVTPKPVATTAVQRRPIARRVPPPPPAPSVARSATPPASETQAAAPATTPTQVETPPLPAQPSPPIAAAVSPSEPSYPPAQPAQPAWQYQPPAAQPHQPPYQQPPQQYVAPNAWPQQQTGWPVTQRSGGASPLSIVAIILGLVALLFLPIILGPIAIILGVVAKGRNEPWAVGGILMGVVGLIAGLIIGYLVYAGF